MEPVSQSRDALRRLRQHIRRLITTKKHLISWAMILTVFVLLIHSQQRVIAELEDTDNEIETSPAWGLSRHSAFYSSCQLARSLRDVPGNRDVTMGEEEFQSEASINLEELLKTHPMPSLLPVNDEYKLTTCIIPKVAGVQWRKIYEKLRNRPRLPGTDGDRGPAPYDYLINHTDEQIKQRLASHLTVIFTRHPIDRLMSAFLQRFSSAQSKEHNVYAAAAMRRYGGRQPESSKDTLTFEEYALWMTDPDPEGLLRLGQKDRLFLPATKLCYPCLVDYRYVGSFDNSMEDMTALLDTVGVSSWIKYPSSTSTTRSHTQRLFEQLDWETLDNVIQRYLLDFVVFDYDPSEPFSYNFTVQEHVRDTYDRLRRMKL